MKIVFFLVAVCFTGASFALTVAWDDAFPLNGQTIDATEILVDGAVVGQVPHGQETYTIDDGAWGPGDYSITARHVGTVDGQAATSEESAPLIYTVADSGVPGVAPLLRFHQLDRAANQSTGAA